MSTNQQNGGVGWLNRMFFHFIVISEKHVIYKMWDYVYVIKGHVLFFFSFYELQLDCMFNYPKWHSSVVIYERAHKF